MSINHRHFNIGMAQNIAQYKDVSAVHHKVAGEGMAQDVGALAFGKFDACPFYGPFKGFSTWSE